jgi:hypothetical protein
VTPSDETPFDLRFVPVATPKSGKNRIHLDLVCEAPEHQVEVVARLRALGALPVDIGQAKDADHVVLADPDGNEFCVVVRGDFLATTGVLGAIVFEPADHALGYFWSEAAGWPIVYDEGGDTAIRAPDGRGPFVTFGPPGGASTPATNRLHLAVAPPPDGDQQAEVAHLVARGARPRGADARGTAGTVLADPDGNEFFLLSPR